MPFNMCRLKVIYYLVMASGLAKGKLLAVIGDEVCVQFVLLYVISFNACLWRIHCVSKNMPPNSDDGS